MFNSIYFTTNCSDGQNNRIGGISGGGNTIINSKYDGKSLILEDNGNYAYAYPSVGGISGGGVIGIDISTCVSSVDGIVYCSSSNSKAFAGGVIGWLLPHEENKLTSMLSVADSITAICKVGTVADDYYTRGGFAGDIAGFEFSEDEIEKNSVYRNNDLSVSATTLAKTVGIARSDEKIKTTTFQRNLLKLGEYKSLSNLETDSNAVWVLRDGDLPEIYYNCLNDITISEDIENGSVTIDKAQAVDGEIVTVTATPNDGYVLNKVYVDGVEQDGTTFVVDGNDEVYVTFAEEIPVFDVSITADENASASLVNADAMTPMLMSVMTLSANDESSITANDGEEIQVNAVADSDYTVDSIYVNGEKIAGNSFILTADSVVTMDVTSISTDITAVTNDAEDVGDYFAVVSGSVSGDSEGISRYIRYWSADDTEIVYTTDVETGSGEYTAELMDLAAETTYYYQMTEFGEIKSFTTCATPDDQHTGGEDGGDSGTSPAPITTTTYKTLISTYKFSIECSQALTTELLAIACYDSNGKLLTLKQIECDGDTTYTGSVPIDTNIDYAKIFVWSSFSSMKPIAGVEIVDITE